MGKRGRTVRQSKKKGKRTTIKHNKRRGGNKQKMTPGDTLMNMLHENTKGIRHSDDEISDKFNSVEENDLYNSILRKKKTLSDSERRAMFVEANRHQEDPMRLIRIPTCKHGEKCYRVNPVHKLVHKMGLYHPASLVAFSMKDKSF
jgi:hypothetical protein